MALSKNVFFALSISSFSLFLLPFRNGTLFSATNAGFNECSFDACGEPSSESHSDMGRAQTFPKGTN